VKRSADSITRERRLVIGFGGILRFHLIEHAPCVLRRAERRAADRGVPQDQDLIHQPVRRSALFFAPQIDRFLVEKRRDANFANDVAFGDHSVCDRHRDLIQYRGAKLLPREHGGQHHDEDSRAHQKVCPSEK
jgi:hypothetical protein